MLALAQLDSPSTLLLPEVWSVLSATLAQAKPAASSFKSEFGNLLLIGCALLGCLLIAWGLQRNAKRKLAERDASEAGYMSPARSQRTQAELAADVSEMATLRQELSDVGRKVVGEIDLRLASLETAIERAEEVAQRLERATRAANSIAPRQGSFDPFQSRISGPIPYTPPAAPPASHGAPAPSLSVSAPAPSTAGAGVEARPATPARGDVQAIIELAAQGQTSMQIAQRLGKPVGQVELILALRGQTKPATPARR